MGPERPVSDEITRDVLAGYAGTFIPRFDRYSRQRFDGSYIAIREPLSLGMVEAHLRGLITLGAYALDHHSVAHWVCFDADDEDEWQGLLQMAHRLKEQQSPAYLEQSRRGGHLWLFTTPLPGRDARRFGKWLLAQHKLETVELYPKQDELRTGPGSLVRLPLGIHRKTGRRYHFITLEGEPLAPTIREQIRLVAQPDTVPHAFIQNILAGLPEPDRVFPTPQFAKRKQVSGDTPSERIKHAISVFDFVSQYVDLDRHGRGCCPFHDDHRQSFSVDVARNYWHCFAGCGGGSLIDFHMQWRELNGQDPAFTATITELAQLLL